MIKYDAQIIRQETETGIVFIFLCEVNNEIIKILQAVFEKQNESHTFPIGNKIPSGIVIEDSLNKEYPYIFEYKDKQGYRVIIEGLKPAEKSIQSKFLKLINKVNEIK